MLKHTCKTQQILFISSFLKKILSYTKIKLQQLIYVFNEKKMFTRKVRLSIFINKNVGTYWLNRVNTWKFFICFSCKKNSSNQES